MKISLSFTMLIIPMAILAGCSGSSSAKEPMQTTNRAAVAAAVEDTMPVTKIEKSDEEWRKTLTEQQYDVMRHKGTERAFTGAYWNNHEKGIYVCAACGLELFGSDAKFESGTGWPSFWQPAVPNHVEKQSDHSLGMDRDEVHCARCGGHLGHLFDDGPKPTGLRYCINSASLSFKKTE